MPAAPAPSTDPAPVVALMYHALREGEVPAGQDPHYTLAADEFDRQMQRIAAGPGGGSAEAHLRGAGAARVLVTFDDGHASNHALAFPRLRRHGIAADFFVNPATVGTPGFARWSELREMAGAGMSIQSHGYDHVYLTHLEPRRLRETLTAARVEIEQNIGRPVTLLAPPGGRMPPDLPAIARECGYLHVLSSQPGLLPPGPRDRRAIPRMAMTAAIGEETFRRWIAGDRLAIGRERLRYQGLAMAKQVLGDAGYERLRARALTLLRGAA